MDGQSRIITRRSLLKTGAASTAFVAMAPSIVRAQEKVLYVNTYGGTIRQAETKAYYQPFTEKTGIQVIPVDGVNIGKLKAAVQTKNYEFDITIFDHLELRQAKLEGLVETIDYNVINKANLVPNSVMDDAGVLLRALSTVIVYRTDKYPNGGPQNWADFWDIKKFPGNRSLINQYFSVPAMALLADGVPIDKIYPMDLDRAFKKLDQIKPHIKVWWTQGNQSEALIHDNEVDMMCMWNGRAQTRIDAGTPCKIAWDGAQLGWIYYGVTKGTPRAKNAWQFIEFCQQAKPQADFSNQLPYGPANPKAFDLLTPATKDKLPTSPEHLKVAFVPDAEWMGPRMSQLQERWSAWVAG